MHSIDQILPKAIATLSSLPPPPASAASPTPPAPLPRDLKGQPLLQDPWQRKWLGLAVTCPETQTACDAVKALAFDWFQHKRPRKVVLYGATGCGKTMLAKALCRWAAAASITAWERKHWGKPPGVQFMLWQETCDRLEDARVSMVELLADAAEESLLIVDDIGAESDRFKSGKGTDALGYLLTRRQGSGYELLTTNIPPNEWEARWDARVADRLLRNSTVCDMSKCPSWATL